MATVAQKERLKKAAFYAQQNPQEFVDALMDIVAPDTSADTGTEEPVTPENGGEDAGDENPEEPTE